MVNVKGLLPALLSLLLLSLVGCGGGHWDGKGKELLAAEESLDSPARVVQERTTPPLKPIYFGFDMSIVDVGQMRDLDFNVKYMKDHPAVIVRIEGNTDPRGTNEYNLALGQRRALAAKKYMIMSGIDESRLNTLSYGEDYREPVGNSEEDYRKNRRADFVMIVK